MRPLASTVTALALALGSAAPLAAQLDLPERTVVVRDFARLRQDLLDTLRVNVPGAEISITQFRGAEVVLEVLLEADRHPGDLDAAREQLRAHCDRLIREAAPGMVLSEASTLTIEAPPPPPEESPEDAALLERLKSAVGKLAALDVPVPAAEPEAEVATPDVATVTTGDATLERLEALLDQDPGAAPQGPPGEAGAEPAAPGAPVAEDTLQEPPREGTRPPPVEAAEATEAGPEARPAPAPSSPLARKILEVFAGVRRRNGLPPARGAAMDTEEAPDVGAPPEVHADAEGDVLVQSGAEAAPASLPPPPGQDPEDRDLLARLRKAVDTLASAPDPAGPGEAAGTEDRIRESFARFRDRLGLPPAGPEGPSDRRLAAPPPTPSVPGEATRPGDAPPGTAPETAAPLEDAVAPEDALYTRTARAREGGAEEAPHPIMREGFQAYLARVTGRSPEALEAERARLLRRARAVAPGPPTPPRVRPRRRSPPLRASLSRPAAVTRPEVVELSPEAGPDAAGGEPGSDAAEVLTEAEARDQELLTKLEHSGAVSPGTLEKVREFREEGAVLSHERSEETVRSIYRTIWTDRELTRSKDALEARLTEAPPSGPLPHLAQRSEEAGPPPRRRGPLDPPPVEELLTSEVLALFDSGVPADLPEEPDL